MTRSPCFIRTLLSACFVATLLAGCVAKRSVRAPLQEASNRQEDRASAGPETDYLTASVRDDAEMPGRADRRSMLGAKVAPVSSEDKADGAAGRPHKGRSDRSTNVRTSSSNRRNHPRANAGDRPRSGSFTTMSQSPRLGGTPQGLPILCEQLPFPECGGECPLGMICEAIAADKVVLPSPTLPAEGDPRDCDLIVSQYEGVGVHALFPGGVDFSDPKHKCFRNVERQDDGAGNEIETFDSIVEGTVDLGNGPMPVTLVGPVMVVVFGKTGNATGTFQTEMVSMSLAGGVGGLPIEIRKSPSLPSPGQTTITDLGGGAWQIDSFFDVFTEVSVAGGPFQPQINGPGRMVLVPVDPGVCECVPDQVPCELGDPATCDGLCPDPNEVCTSNSRGDACFCAPSPMLCEESVFPDCGGDCPPGTHCEGSGADSVVLPSPELPADGEPRDCDAIVSQYEGAGVHALFPGGVDFSDPKHKCFRNVERQDDGSGNEIETFDSTVEGLVDLGGGPMPVTLTGPVTVVVFGKTGNATGTFQTEILSMSLTGNVGGIPIEIRESPGLAASGQTSITDLGGGEWQIDSLFDVFTEVSVNSGPFQPQTNGPGRMELVPVNPAVCECVPDQVPCGQSDPATCDGFCPNPGEVCTPNPLAAPCFCKPPCQSDADCDDGDPCTTDICLADGTCQNTPECTADEDCDDGDVCTTDTCRADGCCDFARIPGCCASDADCPPDPKCHDSFCDLGTNTCELSGPIPGCCASDADCPPDPKCHDSFCDLTTNTCQLSDQFPDCCTNDADCPGKCDICDSVTNRCVKGIPGCCDSDEQCPPDTKCRDSFCDETTNTCQLGDPFPDCCTADADCPGKCDICDLATNTCVKGIPGCCDSDEQCPPGPKCHDSFCDLTTNTCQLSDQIPDCCTADADCPGKCDICDLATNTCVKGIPGCCDSDDQCTDFATKCRPGLCDLGTNTCFTGPYTPTECCEDDSECTHFATQCRPGLCDQITNRCFTGEEVPNCCELGEFPNCDGLCIDPSEVCTPDPAGGPCFCAPPPVSCDQSPFPQCVGDCPTGGVCTADGLTARCRCDSVGGPCSQCGPGPHFIDQCGPFPPAGTDLVANSGAVVGIDLDFDCIRDLNVVLRPCPAPDSLLQIDKTLGPIDDSLNFPGTSPVDGHPTGPGLDVIDTEIVSMCLTNGTVTLVAGAGGPSALPLQPSLGNVAEDLATPDPTMADSLFDVYFEVSGVPGGPVYNRTPLQVRARINCLPPAANYLHPVGICIPLTTKGACGDNGDPCVSNLDCPGSSCDGAVLMANLVSANHSVNQPVCDESPSPQCGGDCPSGMMCLPSAVTDKCGCVAFPCEQSEFPECGGDCPLGTICTGDPTGLGACSCQPTPCERSPYPQCGGDCPPSMACTPDPSGLCSCTPIECAPAANGTACIDSGCSDGGNCLPTCVNFDPQTGATSTIDCECREPSDCHVTADSPDRTGNPCQVPDDGTGTITLPPAGCEYLSPDEVHEIIDGLPLGTTIELDAIHKDFICRGDPAGLCSVGLPPNVCEGPGGSLGGHVDCFDSALELQIAGTGLLAGFTRTLFVPISCEVHTGPRNLGDAIQTFPSEMVRLQGELFGDPDFCTMMVTGGSLHGLPSPGHTTLTRLPSGDFSVDSFFDITYEITFEGCPGSQLEGLGGSTTATLRMSTGSGTTAPSCAGACPANTVCERTVNQNTDGTLDVCCDCIPELPIACCSRLDGECLDLTPTRCVAAGGIPQGPGTTCDDVRCPAVEIDEFPFSIAEVQLAGPLGVQLIQVWGSATARVLFEGPQDGDADDDDGDNLEEVATEMTNLELRGHDPVLGVVVISLNPFIPSPGEIEETANNTAGTLDLPPFTPTGTAKSFFDMHFQIDLPDLGIQMFTIDPKRMSTTIAHKPPGPGALYESAEAIPLYDAAGNQTGYSLIAGRHRPRTRCEMGDIDDDGDLDLDDFGGLYLCLKGPIAGPIDADCLRCFDYDNDGDVDLFDASVFLRLSGLLP